MNYGSNKISEEEQARLRKLAEFHSLDPTSVEYLAKEGYLSTVGIALKKDVSEDQVEKELIRLFQDGKLARLMCEKALRRPLTEEEISHAP